MTKTTRLGVESLEARDVPSWGAVAPATHVGLNYAANEDDFAVGSFDRSGNYAATSAITRNEADYRTFVAPRTGTYTFEAKAAAGSKIDTVAALYSASGVWMNGNDDFGAGLNSKFTYTLQAGRVYEFGVSNYNGSANGRYDVVVTAPSLTGFDAVGGASSVTNGNATLTGTNLHLHLDGETRTKFGRDLHQIRVEVLDRNGAVIAIPPVYGQLPTSGKWVTGPSWQRSMDWDVDLSGYDLSHAASLRVRVWV